MEKQSFNDFRNEIQRKNRSNVCKVRDSWGAYDAYKHIRRNKWYDIGKPVSEYEFYYIIRTVNNMLADNLANGKSVLFPHRMGKLELRKKPCGVSIVGGKLKITYPIAWKETMELWYEDEEARRNKTLVRDEVKEVFKVKYDKYEANYENKTFYQFAVNTFIKRRLKDNIKEGKIDTFLAG